MFEPLPSVVRLRREERGMTQEGLARKAKVSRGQLIAFEKGEQNVTLLFLLKIARALEITELPVAELHLTPAMPDLTVLIAAADAVAAAERVVTQAAGSAGALHASAESVRMLLERALASRQPYPEINTATRLAQTPPEQRETIGRHLRELAELPPAPRPRAERAAPAAKPAARRRSK
jgi:transcriptional regulator with XRE-family HTH domain